MLSISFELKEEDVRAFDLHHYKESLRVKGARMIGWVGVSAALFGAAAMVFLEAGDWKFFGYPILVVAVLVTALYPKYYEPGLVNWGERSLRGVPSEGRVGPRRMTFTEEGIIAGDAKVFWAEVLSVASTQEHLFILMSWGSGFVIPRREIPGATIQAVTEFAEERIRSTERRAAGERR